MRVDRGLRVSILNELQRTGASARHTHQQQHIFPIRVGLSAAIQRLDCVSKAHTICIVGRGHYTAAINIQPTFRSKIGPGAKSYKIGERCGRPCYVELDVVTLVAVGLHYRKSEHADCGLRR